MLTKNVEHHFPDGALARALLTALQDENNAGVFVRVLDKPSKQLHQVPKFLLIVPADHVEQMSKKAALLLPSLARFNVETAPEIEFVGRSCTSWLEHKLPLVSVGALFPKFLGRNRLRGPSLHENILNLKLELVARNECHRSIIVDAKDGGLHSALADKEMGI